jgi:hypothetical protein
VITVKRDDSVTKLLAKVINDPAHAQWDTADTKTRKYVKQG